MKVFVGLVGMLILLSSLGTVYGDTFARNEIGEVQVENANYEVSYSGTIQVKIFGEITDSSGTNKILITITKPDGDKEELSIIPSTHGYFETYLLFDRNHLKGIYEAEAFTYDGKLIGKISFQIYDKNNPIVITKEPEVVPEPKPVEIKKKPTSTENKPSLPSWIKTIAGFWAKGDISDDEYLTTIEWLIDNEIIKISRSQTKIVEDLGDFIPVFEPTNDPNLKAVKQALEEMELLERQAKMFNIFFKLPYDVPVKYSECGVANAFYNSDKKEITFCYEFLFYLLALFYYDEDYESITKSVLLFVGFHELGHAIVDIYDIPITGLEEDAVDQLASYFLIGNAVGPKPILETGKWFIMESEIQSSNRQLAFWDEHSLNQQRFYNTLCWLYGSSPSLYESFVTSGLLPEERAFRCPSEYEQIERSWAILLDPYLQEIK